MKRANKKIPKEISNGLQSKQYKFFYDAEGVLGEREICYLMFKPEDGPYTNQTHILSIQWRYGTNEKYEYPDDPPNIRFMTPVLHSNIGVQGNICLDILKKGTPENGCAYSPAYGIDAFFESIRLLLNVPTPSSPLNGEAAKLYNRLKDSPDYYKHLDDWYFSKLPSSQKFFSVFN